MHRAQREKVHRALKAGVITILALDDRAYTFTPGFIESMVYVPNLKRSYVRLQSYGDVEVSYPVYRMVKCFWEGKDPSNRWDPWMVSP